jgi:hypothetical protein
VLSFIIFGKSLTAFHMIGGFTVFSGIAIHQSTKASNRRQEQRGSTFQVNIQNDQEHFNQTEEGTPEISITAQ